MRSSAPGSAGRQQADAAGDDLPDAPAAPVRSGDATCTRPLAASPVKRCLPLTFAYQLEGTASNRVARVFPAPVLHQGPVFTNASGACTAAPMQHPKGYPEYDLGPEIPLDQLADLRIAEP